MAYEIPQNLKYEEKIVFGLTLKQFGWITLFGILAVIIFLKTPISFYAKIVIAITLVGIGFSFAFLNLFTHIKILKKYFGLTKAGYLQPQLDSFMEVKEIKDNAIFLKDGSIKAIIQVIPFNFSMLSIQEQQAIINAYKQFLNSLDFPIQIVMRTINLSLNEYLLVLEKKVHATKKTSLLNQFDSFKKFIQKFINEKKIKNRLFYIIIPIENNQPTLFFGKKVKEKEKIMQSQLNVRIKVCQEKLRKCNLLTKQLNSQELVSLLASFFEGFIEAQNEYFFPTTTLQENEKTEETKKSWFNALGQKIETKPILKISESVTQNEHT